MKKGVLGTIVLIYGIVIFVAGISTFFLGYIGEFMARLAAILGLFTLIPAIVLGIIAIIKKSNRSGAIIGMILTFVGTFSHFIFTFIGNLTK